MKRVVKKVDLSNARYAPDWLADAPWAVEALLRRLQGPPVRRVLWKVTDVQKQERESAIK